MLGEGPGTDTIARIVGAHRTLGTVALGYAFLGEALTPLKVLSALAIVAGVAGLKISAG